MLDWVRLDYGTKGLRFGAGLDNFCVNNFYSFKRFLKHISTSDNILSVPRVDVVVHISSPIIAIVVVVVVSSVVHHVRPGIP